MKKVVSLLLCLALVLGMIPGSLFMKADAANENVVQDTSGLDLVLWLDANNNTGKGTHDGNATEWVNLANPSEKIDVTNHVWGKDAEHGSYYLYMKNGYIILPDAVRQAIGSENFTVEFIMDDFDAASGSAKCIMNTIGDDAWIAAGGDKTVVNDNFVIFQNASGGNSDGFCFRTCYGSSWTPIYTSYDYAKAMNTTALSNATNTITFDHDGKTNWYQNGVFVDAATNTGKTITMDGFKVGGTWQTERKPQVVFGAPDGLIGGRKFDGKVQAIRIYKGNLTEEQIKQNAAYDQAHYYNDANAVAQSAVPGGYTTGGLVLFLDANKNNGKGYDANATQWVNLANLAESVGANGHSFGTDGNYLHIKNGYIKLPEAVRQAIASGVFTIEFVMDDYAGDPTHTSGGIANIMAVTGSNKWIAGVTTPGGTPNDNFVIYQYSGSGDIRFKTNSTPNEAGRVKVNGGIDKVTQSLVYNAGTFTWYQGAQSKGTASTYDAKPNVGDGYQIVFGACLDTVSNRAFEGKVKAIRVYNKVLTEAEIAANAAVDQGYYYHTHDWSDEWTTDNGYHWHTCQAAHCPINANVDMDGWGQHVYEGGVCTTCGHNDPSAPATIAVPQGYVTDNLVFFVDANLNTGTGYDPSVTEWVDLTDPTGATKVKTNGAAWGESEYGTHYLQINNSYILLPDEVRQAIAGENFSVEFIMEGYTSSDKSNIINVMCVTGDDAWIKSMKDAGKKGGVVNDNFVLFVTQSTDSTTYDEIKFRTAWWDNGWNITVPNTSSYARVNGSTIEHKTVTYTFDHDGYSYNYLNGTQTPNGKTQNQDGKTISLDGFIIDGSWQTARKPQVAFGAATDVINSRSFYGKVKAIRIYSDVLTADEAAQNALADNARYYPDDADHTHVWDTEWTQTATEHYRACTVDNCEYKYSYGAHDYSSDEDATCNTCGYTRAIKSVIASYDVDIYEPTTDVNTAPIIMQMAGANMYDVSGEAKRPSSILFDLKLEGGVLTAYAYRGAAKLGTWADMYAANYGKANLGVRIDDLDTAKALATWVSTERVGNLWVISNDVEQIDTVTDAMDTVRGVVDLTGDSVRGPGNIKFDFDTDGDGTVEDKTWADAPNKVIGGEYANNAKRTYDWVTYTKGSKASVYENMAWADVYDLIFAEGYRTIIIPESAATQDHIYFLQGSLVYTIVESDASTAEEYYDLIVGGANGIIAPDYATYINVLEGDLFKTGKNTLVRGGSIVGHRGDMGYAVKGEKTVPENSIESIVSAAQSGASSVEFDMYMTLDGELVLNHNASIAGYFTYGPNTPDNITRVADSVGIKERYWYGDLEYLVSTYNSEIPMQRLQDLYEAVDTEYPELRLHHEIKDGRIENLNRTIELMDKYGLRDRSDMMCFTRSVVAYTSSMGISSQYLSSVSKHGDSDRMYNMEKQYRPLNSTWHATWGDVTTGAGNTEFLEEMKHFGQTAYPWATYSTTNGQWYQDGYQGFTTNAPHHTDNYIRELVLNFDAATGAVSATASTLADHKMGTAPTRSQFVPDDYVVVTLPDYLEEWWIDKGCATGINEYEITEGLEVVVLKGAENITVANGVITRGANQSGEATVAVRYLQSWNGATFYIYSKAVEITAPLYDHTHTFDSSWKYNDTHHWHPCTTAGCKVTDPAELAAENGYAQHVYADDNDFTCDCGYTRTIARVPAGYVEDGLVLYLDGLDNTATGTHSNTSEVWVNLANIAQQIAVPDGSTHTQLDADWGSNYLDLSGYVKLPANILDIIASGEFTIEFVMDDYSGVNDHTTNGVTQNIMALVGNDAWIATNTKEVPTLATPNDEFVIYQNRPEWGGTTVHMKNTGDGSATRANVKATSIDGVTNAITRKTGTQAVWYQNGVVASTSGYTYTSAPAVAGDYQVIFGAAVDTVAGRRFHGKVSAIRIYDRVLTAAEIAANAAADEGRYGEQLTGASVPAGYSTDGLVVFLDGIDNAGTGEHKDGSFRWVNLANRSEYATFLAGGSNSYAWTEDGLTVNGGVILPASALEAVAGSNFTVEFYVTEYDPTIHASVTRNILVLIGPDGSVAGANGGVWDDDFVSFQNSTNANPDNDDLWCFDIKKVNPSNSSKRVAYGRISVGAGSINDTTNAITFDHDVQIQWLQNGVAKSTGKSGASADWKSDISLTNGTRLLFGAASGHMSNRAFAGEIKAIRIYNRTLTADELKAHSVLDTIRYGELDVNAVAQESWNNVVGNTGKLTGTGLADLQAYAESQISVADAVEVKVTDAGNGAYTFTYTLAGSTQVLNTHTFYVDTEYTIVMGDLTADEQAELLNDVVKFQGSSGNNITVNWDNDSNALYYKGTDDSVRPVTHLYFPAYVSGDAYVYEAEVGFDSYGGWSTMTFGAENFENHYQYAFWGNMTSTGAEFVRHQTKDGSGTWAVGHSNITKDVVAELLGTERMNALYNNVSGKYQVKDTVTYKVIVHNGILYGFIDGVQVLTTVAAGTIKKDFYGVFGFNTSSSALNIHSVSVRPITAANEAEEMAGVKKGFNPVKSYDVDIYEPDTDVNTAPIVMQTAIAGTADVSGEAKRPSAIIFTVKVENGVLNAYDGSTLLGTFADLYRANQPKANVGVRIAAGDKETANALAAEAKELSAGNLWLISSDVEILNIVTDELPVVRGVVDFTGDTVRGPGNIRYSFDTDGNGVVDEKNEVINAELGQYKVIGGEYANKTAPTYDWVTYTGGYAQLTWDQMYDILLTCGYRTAILPESAVTKDHVYFLQGSMIYTIVETDADTEAEFYDLISTGVNGILSTAYDVNIATLEGDLFDANGEEIIIRGGGIVGHRGDMGNAVKGGTSLPENSIEAIVSAAQSGASSVEFDMYMTLDGYLVLNHNTSIKGYFTYGPNTPANVVRVSDDVTIVNRYWKGDLEYMVSTYNPNIPMQQLYQLYEAVDTEYPELRLHHELKDVRVETINRTIELMEQYGLRSRSDLMCSTYSILQYTSSMGISTQSIGMYSNKNTENRIYAAEANYRPINSTWHTQWTYINTEYLEELKHFGETAYPWATYSSTYAGYYVQGYQGFTTDAPHHTDDIIRELIPVLDPVTGKVTVTARTLAYHEKGVFNDDTLSGEKPIRLPDYLEEYWVDKGYSNGIREYDLTGFEIIAVAGNPVIDNANLTVTGTSAEDRVAVRYKQTLTESDGQTYSFWIYSQSIEVTRPQEVTFPNANETVTYGDELTVTATTNGTGTITYTSSDETVATVDPATGKITTVGVGTTVITATASANGTWLEGQASYTLTVLPKPVAEPTVKGSYTYTGAEITVELEGVERFMTVVSGTKGTDAGDYEVVITLDNNHVWAQGSDGKVQWAIGKAQAVITVDTTPIVVTYGDELKLPEATTNFGTVTCDKTPADLVNAGTYTVTYTVASTDNWNGTEVTVSVTVEQREVVLHWSALTAEELVYDGQPNTLYAQAFNLVEGDNCAVTVELVGDNVNVGTFHYVATALSNPNYKLPANVNSPEYTITAKALTVTANDNTVTYGDAPIHAGVSYDGFVTGEDASVLGGALVYTYSYEQYGDVGEYTITPAGLTSGNYAITFVDGTLTVVRKAITVTAEDKSKTYGDADPELTYTVEGLVNNDGMTGALTREEGEDVGTYAIKQGTLTAGGNYDITFVEGTLTVSQREVGLHWSTLTAEELVYDGQPNTLYAQATGLMDGDNCGVTVVLVGDNVNVGTFHYTATALSNPNYKLPADVDSPEYTVTPKAAHLTALDRQIMITFDPIDFSNPVEGWDYTVTGLVEGDEILVTMYSDVDMNVDGYYTIYISAENGNYAFTYTYGTLIVTAGSYDGGSGSGSGGGTVVVPPVGDSCQCHKFTDINTGLWYHDAICYAVNNGIMNGTGNGTTFSPYLNLSRAMMMTMLARLDGVDTTTGSTWYEVGMKWAMDKGISDGTNPHGDITREQMVTMLYRYAGKPVIAGNLVQGYKDADQISGWAYDAMNWAVTNGIIQGAGDGNLNPQGTATRAEIAQILYNYLTRMGY